MAGRVVPVAYVTKWAGGIRVLRHHSTSDHNPSYLRLSAGRLAGPSEWTEDRDVAIGRYVKALRKRVASAQKELTACTAALTGEPEFIEAA